MKRILIIGGGPAGVMAAIEAALNKCEVTIIEKKDRILKKLLVTGNGKCNLTNMDFHMDCYYSNEKSRLKEYFEQFDVADTILFFKQLGLLMKDKNGYIYPVCEQASVVSDVLRNKLSQLNVNIQTQTTIDSIRNEKDQFKVKIQDKEYCFDALIIACGSYAGNKKDDIKSGYEWAEELGHHIIPVLPALVQVKCKENFFKSISGVRCEAILKLMIENQEVHTQRGELQLTDYGISGIPVFQFSRQIAEAVKQKKKTEVEIDFLPEYDEQDWNLFIQNRILSNDGVTIETFFAGLLNKKINQMMIKQFGLHPLEILSVENSKKVKEACARMKHFIVTPIGTNPYENAQTCAGGVDLRDIDEKMQSRKMKNLFFCGEILDVDGKCGGYNLQWAWTSGYIAGKNSANC